MRKLADQGQAILCTIHQPSSLLFESFDRLLLLERGGETVYFGDIGADSQVIREYFARHGAQCPSNVNPAEYMLEAIGAGVSPRIGDRDWKDVWLGSQEYQQVRNEIKAIKEEALSRPELDRKTLSTCSFFTMMSPVIILSECLQMLLLSCISSDWLFNGTTLHCGDRLTTSSLDFSLLDSFLYLSPCPSCNSGLV